jgi:hypothetical protein
LFLRGAQSLSKKLCAPFAVLGLAASELIRFVEICRISVIQNRVIGNIRALKSISARHRKNPRANAFFRSLVSLIRPMLRCSRAFRKVSGQHQRFPARERTDPSLFSFPGR